MKISVAGNIEPPLFKILKSKGFQLVIESKIWIAKKDELEFRADNIIELAGIVFLFEEKGNKWKVEDAVIDEYLEFLKQNDN